MEQKTDTDYAFIKSRKSIIYRILQIREIGVLVALVVLVVLVITMSIASPYFLKDQNLFNVLRSMSTIGIIAIGMTMIIITAGIDLSVGSILALCAMFCARLIYFGFPPILSLIAGLLLGLVVGAINGIIITKLKISFYNKVK